MGGVLDFLKGEKKRPDVNEYSNLKAAGITIPQGDPRISGPGAKGVNLETMTPTELEKWNKYVESQMASKD